MDVSNQVVSTTLTAPWNSYSVASKPLASMMYPIKSSKVAGMFTEVSLSEFVIPFLGLNCQLMVEIITLLLSIFDIKCVWGGFLEVLH